MDRVKPFLEQHEYLKHAGDTLLIPAGLGAGVLGWLELINAGLTFVVLITSAIWGIYRVLEMHEKRAEKDD